MRNFPLQTIFLNLFASAIVFFPKAPSCKQCFCYIFFTMLSSLVLKIFQLFFEKKSLIPREDPLLLILKPIIIIYY